MNLDKYPTLSKALEGNDMAKLQLMSYVADCEKADAIAFYDWVKKRKALGKSLGHTSKLYLKYLEETSEE